MNICIFLTLFLFSSFYVTGYIWGTHYNNNEKKAGIIIYRAAGRIPKGGRRGSILNISRPVRHFDHITSRSDESSQHEIYLSFTSKALVVFHLFFFLLLSNSISNIGFKNFWQMKMFIFFCPCPLFLYSCFDWFSCSELEMSAIVCLELEQIVWVGSLVKLASTRSDECVCCWWRVSFVFVPIGTCATWNGNIRARLRERDVYRSTQRVGEGKEEAFDVEPIRLNGEVGMDWPTWLRARGTCETKNNWT